MSETQVSVPSSGFHEEPSRWRQMEWVQQHFGDAARITGDCSCGRQMSHAEYLYRGGTFGQYICSDCGTEWTVDLNGAMWPSERPEHPA